MYFSVNLKNMLFYMDSIYLTQFHSCKSVNKENLDDRFAGKVGDGGFQEMGGS